MRRDLAPEIKAETSQPLPEPMLVRCIEECQATAEFHAAKGNAAWSDWWHSRADMYADQLATYREIPLALAA